MSVLGVILVCIFLHSDWIWRDNTCLSVFSPNTGKCGKNADENNSEYGQFLRNTCHELPSKQTIKANKLKVSIYRCFTLNTKNNKLNKKMVKIWTCKNQSKRQPFSLFWQAKRCSLISLDILHPFTVSY